MDLLNSRDKINIFFILFIILLISTIFCAKPGWALDPTVTDVTTRSFSVVWTEGAVINPDSHSCSLTVKMGGVEIDSNQIIEPELDAEGQSNEEGRLGLERGIVKYEVIMLNPNSTYTVNGKKSNGSTSLFTSDEIVTTEKFKGLSAYADANDHDIVTNDIVHLAIYDYDGETPGLGALVMGEIYSDAECTSSNKLSDKPITGWVGTGMPGEAGATDFDPNDISYKQYAPLNFLNVFGQDNYPLQLTGDDVSTPQVEGEYIKVNVIEGIVNVAGETEYIMPVPEITQVEVDPDVWQKISSAKVASKIVFQAKMNLFTYPYEIPQNYTVKKLVEAILAAGGEVSSIKIHQGGATWLEAKVLPNGSVIGAGASLPVEPGKGYLVIMKDTLPPNFFISNSPTPTTITLKAKMNVASFTQIPSFYKIKDLAETILAADGKISSIKVHQGGATWLEAKVLPNGSIIGAGANELVETGRAYLIIMKDTQTEEITIDPLAGS